jgi:transposase InsO family protein
METNELLEKLYYDLNQGGSLGSVDALYHAAKKKNRKVTKREVQEWLRGQRVYSLHRPVRKRFRRNRVMVGSIDAVWEIDLIDMQSLKKYNSNYRYMLTCIDVLSKYAWVIPIKNKSAPTLVAAFKRILDNSDRKPDKVHSDRGSEFTNRLFQSFLKEKNIGFYHTFNDVKASIVERFNRTIQQRIYRYFTWKGTLKYLDALPEIVDAYNNSYHRSIKRTPASVNKNNDDDVWMTLYGNPPPKRGYAFNIGDPVRISKSKKLFEKGYLPNWSEEVFKISKRIPRNPPVYKLTEFDGDVLEGTFYEQELQRVKTKGEDEIYKIERILKTRKRGKHVEYFVKWLGYPDKYNSWVSSSDIE